MHNTKQFLISYIYSHPTTYSHQVYGHGETVMYISGKLTYKALISAKKQIAAILVSSIDSITILNAIELDDDDEI